jgi:hypothetical protein
MDGLWPALPTPAEEEILRTPVKQPE